MPINPLDTTTTPEDALQRRLAALEARAEDYERNRTSQIMFFHGNPVTVPPVVEGIEAGPPGSVVAVDEENEVGGSTVIFVNFPPPYGVYSI